MGEGKQHAISSVLMRIHQDCTQALTMAELSAQAHMSQSVFFEAFKSVTASSPLQYIKRRRLMEAHRRLRLGLANVSEAAYGVGYNSTSQFSREFKRLYGVSPSEISVTQSPLHPSIHTQQPRERS